MCRRLKRQTDILPVGKHGLHKLGGSAQHSHIEYRGKRTNAQDVYCALGRAMDGFPQSITNYHRHTAVDGAASSSTRGGVVWILPYVIGVFMHMGSKFKLTHRAYSVPTPTSSSRAYIYLKIHRQLAGSPGA